MNLIRRMAIAFGIAIAVLQSGRGLLWGHSPQHWTGWFYILDAYLVAGLLIAGVVIARRKEIVGRLTIAAGWGFSCGILYRSFFEQMRDPTRQGGHEVLVLAFKGALLAFSAAGLAVTVSRKNEEKANQPPEPTLLTRRG